MKTVISKAFVILMMVSVLVVSCNKKPVNKMIGIWEVEHVDANFDESKINPAALEQVIATEKQTKLNFSDDSTLFLTIGETNQKAFWNQQDNSIFFFFDGDPLNVYELGNLVNDKIESESETPIGTIKVIYSKKAE